MKHRLSLILLIGVGMVARAAEGDGGQKTTPVTPASNSAAWAQVHALEQQEKRELQSLTQQMADLKEKHQTGIAPLQQQLASFNGAFDSWMKQLRDQYDATRTHDNDKRAALMDRILPGYLALYNEKKASLASVNAQESQAIQSLRQQEDSELQSIRDKYDAQLKGREQEASTQRQAIDSKFETDVKGLK